MDVFRKISSSIFVCVFATLFYTIFSYGISLKMNETIPEAIEDHTWCISAAISDIHYKLNEGYVYFPQVFETLSQYGMTKYNQYLDSLPTNYPDNLTDPILLNNALQQALSLSLKQEGRSLGRKEITPIPASDIGLVDYYKLAFRFFGYQVNSPYTFFFVLLALTSFIFFLTFLNHPIFLCIPSLVCVGIILLMQISPHDPIFNFHYLPILVVLPTLHIGLLELRAQNQILNVLEKSSILLQALFISFIITTRSSAGWAVVGLLGLYSVNFVKHFLKKEWSVIIHQFNDYKYGLYTLGILIGLITFVKSYKQVMFFCCYGTSTFRNYHLYCTSVLVSIGIISFFVTFFLKKGALLFPTLTSKQGKLSQLFFCFVLPMPIVLFIIKERLDCSIYSIQCLLKVLYWVQWFLIICIISLLLTALVKHKSYTSIFHKFKEKPVFIFLCVFFSSQLFLNTQYHCSYFINDTIPHHLAYHNAFIGLRAHPKVWKQLFQSGKAGCDSISWRAGYRRFCKDNKRKKVTFEDYTSPYTGTMKMKIHDKKIRKVYFKFFRQHPIQFFVAHLYKIKDILVLFGKYTGHRFNTILMLFLGFNFLMLIFSLLQSEYFQDLSKLAYVFSFLAPAAALPNFYAMTHAGPENCQLTLLIFLFIGTSYSWIKMVKIRQTKNRFLPVSAK